jgi:hypothetical protein
LIPVGLEPKAFAEEETVERFEDRQISAGAQPAGFWLSPQGIGRLKYPLAVGHWAS